MTPGTKLGQYAIVALIGAGGMGDANSLLAARWVYGTTSATGKIHPSQYVGYAVKLSRTVATAHCCASSL